MEKSRNRGLILCKLRFCHGKVYVGGHKTMMSMDDWMITLVKMP